MSFVENLNVAVILILILWHFVVSTLNEKNMSLCQYLIIHYVYELSGQPSVIVS